MCFLLLFLVLFVRLLFGGGQVLVFFKAHPLKEELGVKHKHGLK